MIRIPEYEEILNCYKNIIFLSYQENTNRIYVQYCFLEEEKSLITSIYTLKDNKIKVSGCIVCIKYNLNDIIDITEKSSIILNDHKCKCLQFIDNEYKIAKKFDEKFYSIKACPKRDKFIAVTENKIVVIDTHSFQYITVLKHTFIPSVCILNKKYFISMRKYTGFVEVLNLNNFKLLSKMKNIYLADIGKGVGFYNCGNSEYFIYGKQQSCCDLFVAEFKNNSLNDVYCLDKISPSSSFLYINDYLLVGQRGKIIIFKKTIRKQENSINFN
jgi:hypothetical protein